MENTKKIIWSTKISFWGAATLLTIGVCIMRSPWWLIGFGLLLLVSFRAITLCRIPLSTVFPLFLCNIYFIIAFFKIVFDENASSWWLTVALFLEFIIVGNAQNQVVEDEKKSKIAEETGNTLTEEKNTDFSEQNESKKIQPVEDDICIAEKDKIQNFISALKNSNDSAEQIIGTWFESVNRGFFPDDARDFCKLDFEVHKIFMNKFITLLDNTIKQAESQGVKLQGNEVAGLIVSTFFTHMLLIVQDRLPITAKLFAIMTYIGTPLQKRLKDSLSELSVIAGQDSLAPQAHNYFVHLESDIDYDVEMFKMLIPRWLMSKEKETFSQFAKKHITSGADLIKRIMSNEFKS